MIWKNDPFESNHLGDGSRINENAYTKDTSHQLINQMDENPQSSWLN